MAKTVRVLPRDDGLDYRGSWMVHVDGTMKSPHTTKEAAKNAATRYANEGDRIVIHRQDGTIQDSRTYSGGGSSGGGETAPTIPYGKEAFETGVADFFDR